MSIAILPLAIFAASQVGTPGPANMALLATGARFGFRAALPFVAGVALGKQLIIWPIGFGLMELAEAAPGLFLALKYISAAYIIWLAWKVANLRLDAAAGTDNVPGFAAGLLVHPLNPKAWAMIVGGFTAFVGPDTSTLTATATIAAVLLGCQIVLHPIWTLAGDRIAKTVAGTRAEPYLMWTLAGLTVASVLFVLFGGGT
ncbi:LysE family translocator [Sulfitobacter sp. M57]|uniref:LysE family translocator n=1 Tax=unclassified Sulfitobacter TaxID=196795 RepID=UPI0023E20BA5|nr:MULTISPECIES: LysE family translocator [unclassified Sulfitobacter]MDF3413732.1 LysE family translocator [Sulfitobacter sp. KE5]MDF3420987.1 LysE family translocator [Sulfitobacter sp. KE43]MDF3432278.1 LysE family translocator [Sulfitobacter sp. KE42]MDF3457917.1 LysE family translocator [Sulfitobacter sp. S74]MDF3461818.1 LysE family translocator [Sulfitobacter sp. Ks18]